jgi:predicted nucleic acid-binding protein
MLVDTGAWYAMADVSERHHEEARRFYLAQAPEGRFVTTDLIGRGDVGPVEFSPIRVELNR